MNGEAPIYYIPYPGGCRVVLRVLHIALLANNPKITNMECLLFVSSGHSNTEGNIYSSLSAVMLRFTDTASAEFRRIERYRSRSSNGIMALQIEI